ncbi:uroporphyrinogen-III C-methyltransferase [Akkermansiaceae bacterium]|nr:uroporphyrinogen-III C-methyltransferase [bacterium]MDB4296852.1 uroporphyrinogen-III C-methyltransferase [Akkermansiaceae bacterium]MDB4288627.1 uroporphyrinogen-III C-methyltransferase [bacterium]MDB4540996.1 uroporphyrinogen-III C-methyltransferase [Akkermansiaceae bacterium]MDB4619983.1 uroporphyrinogen-III C-methyltransferase [Akkermansiaceae bacterium]
MGKKGICYLVGAGPGDVGLVTLKAKECIEKCDVLVYDALSSAELVGWTKKGCELIFAGKRALDHAIPQDKINDLIVEKTLEGKIVTRLKGGDPMIFGRGGEEAAELAEAGVKFEIVPGISSTIAGPAYAGIPVTHRDHCSQLTIFTGHEDPTKEDTSLDFEQLAKAPGTKVFVMGVARLRGICEKFIEGGASSSTPIALTRWATTGKHRTIEGTLKTIADIAEKENFKSPAVAVVGNVVKERKKINWFETRPLLGKRIVVTRTREQAGELSKQLGDLGADVVELPTIRIEHPQDKMDFAQMVADAHTYDWLIFTSPNGVEKFFDAFYATYQDARSLGGPRIAAIGPSTEAKIREYRFTVDLLPEKFVAEGLVEAFKKENVEHQKLLWIKAEETRDVLYHSLMDLGAIVDSCLAYRTVPETEDPTGAAKRLAEDGADMITFTSGSTAENFFKMGIDWPEGCVAGSIGPVTSKTFKSLSEETCIESQKHDIPGLVAAILKHFKK